MTWFTSLSTLFSGTSLALFLLISTLLCGLTLGYVLLPLWKRTFELMLASIMTLSLATLMLYQLVGTSAIFNPEIAKEAPQTLEQAVAQLESELKRNPNQPDGWVLLAQSYSRLNDLPKAADAYIKAITQNPDQPDLLVEAAQAQAIVNNNQFTAQGIEWLNHALELDPNHQRALWFIGITYMQKNQPAKATEVWERLLPIVDPATQMALRTQIDTAREAAKLPALPPLPGIPVLVDLSPKLKATIPPEAVIFIMAKQVNGAPMPVAAKRIPVKDFPIAITLTDADSPMPTLKLSQAGQVEVSARISLLGEPTAATGDIQSNLIQIDMKKSPPSKPLLLLLENIVP